MLAPMSAKRVHKLARMITPKDAATRDYSRDAETWFRWAEMTFAASQALFADGSPFLWFGGAVLGHQALEMYLKTILIGAGRRVARDGVSGHDLLDLMKQVEATGIILPPELGAEFQIFNGFFKELRYPTPLKEVAGLGDESEHLRIIVETLRPHAESASRKKP